MADERTAITPWEAVSITALCFGWAILGSFASLASDPQGNAFTDAAFFAMILSELLWGGIALAILGRRGYAIRSLFPAPSLSGCALGIALFIAGAALGMLAATPFYSAAAPQPIETMVDHAVISLPMLIAAALVNGNFEEIFLLGYLTRGLEGYGAPFAVGAALLVRALYHLYQGPVGVISVLGFGLVLGVYYMRTRNLFPVVFAHVLADIVPFVASGAA